MTFTDALNYVFNRISTANDDSLLTVTLTRFAIHCANLPGAARWLDLFTGEFYLERVRLNHLAASAKMDANQVKRIQSMIKP